MKAAATGWSAAVLASLLLLSACPARQARRLTLDQPVRVLERLPQGLQCEPVNKITLRDGTGCGYLGRTQQGSEASLMYNLQQKARQQGANLVIPGPITPDSWEGCPANGLLVEAELFYCDFGAK